MTSLVPPLGTGSRLFTVEHFVRIEDGVPLRALLWRAGPGWRMASSAVLGGGIADRDWVLNAQVAHGYQRDDPDRHLADLARGAHCDGSGVGLMTAADVSAAVHADDGGVECFVTAGMEVRGWAASPQEGASGTPEPGTINIVAALPVALSDAALVNAVATATEAKVQALLEAGYRCSGTPTDAVCIAAHSPRLHAQTHNFAGPRSLWGARLARAVHRAVHAAATAPKRT